jgi:lipopolysaccharide/colanic/teichoic acid biosynthesis glycosyltransferase
VIRRALDVLIAGSALLLSAPLLAIAVVAIRLESPGPAIYRQRRVGLRGREFDVLKLRTMVQGAEHMGAGLAVNHNDARITRVGALLRRTSLDELPQLVNILRGDMSVIGPRPTVPVQVRQYTPRQRGRLAIKPGITGWAQVNGRTALPWSERIELDLWYIEHRSLALDLGILWRTVAVVLGGEDLYKGQTGGWQPDPAPAGPGGGPAAPAAQRTGEVAGAGAVEDASPAAGAGEDPGPTAGGTLNGAPLGGGPAGGRAP